MTAYLEALMTLPGLTIGLAWFLHEREDRALSGETAGKHRRERVERTNA